MEIKEIFRKKFGLPFDGYSEAIDLQDAGVGFSVYKKQEDLKREGFKSMFKVYVRNEELRKEDDEKSVIITASYGKETDDGIILGSGDLDGNHFERGINWPAELIVKDEFFYNTRTHDFYYGRKVISGKEILDKINDWHLKPTKVLKGFKYRAKLRYHKLITKSWEILFDFVSLIEYIFSGNKKKDIYDLEEKSREIKEEIIKKYREPIDIFGYKIELQTALIYSMIHLLFYFIFYYYNFKPSWLVNIFGNNFLVIMYVILTLTSILKGPTILLRLIRDQYYRSIFKAIKL